jgi:integrase-like protein
MTVGTFMDQWFDFAKSNLKPCTIKRYREAIEIYITPTFGDTELHKVNAFTVQDMYAQMLRVCLARIRTSAGKPSSEHSSPNVISPSESAISLSDPNRSPLPGRATAYSSTVSPGGKGYDRHQHRTANQPTSALRKPTLAKTTSVTVALL